MALIGYRAERVKMTQKIAEIEARLGGRRIVSSDGAAPRRRRRLSAAALANIRVAQKKRWAAFHKERGQ